MKLHGRDALLWTGLWLVLLAVSLATRPLMPIDETRYASVAWEMWLRGDFLVPYLNGVPYSHKPPLLFWLFHLGCGFSASTSGGRDSYRRCSPWAACS